MVKVSFNTALAQKDVKKDAETLIPEEDKVSRKWLTELTANVAFSSALKHAVKKRALNSAVNVVFYCLSNFKKLSAVFYTHRVLFSLLSKRYSNVNVVTFRFMLLFFNKSS